MSQQSRVLLVYTSREGHTRRIMERIAARLQTRGVTGELFNAEQQQTAPALTEFGCVVIAGPIHYGHYHPQLAKFVQQHLQALEQRPSIFVSINLTARKPNKNTAETSPYVSKFLTKVNWQPSEVEVFAGALKYDQLRPFDRFMIRFIMWMTKGPTDVNQHYDFTPWDEVDQFADKLVGKYSLSPEPGKE